MALLLLDANAPEYATWAWVLSYSYRLQATPRSLRVKAGKSRHRSQVSSIYVSVFLDRAYACSIARAYARCYHADVFVKLTLIDVIFVTVLKMMTCFIYLGFVRVRRQRARMPLSWAFACSEILHYLFNLLSNHTFWQ